MLLKYTDADGADTKGEFFDRAEKVWGTTKLGEKADKRYNELCKFVALINGAAHGWNEAESYFGISKKYEDLRQQILVPVNEDECRRVLNEMFSIYEDADVRKPIHDKKELKKNRKAQKDIGNFTGAIVYSLKTFPDEWPRVHAGWVDFLVRYRENNNLLHSVILGHVSGARSWNRARWEMTYNRVFGVVPETQVYPDDATTATDSHDEGDEDDDPEY
jgi:opacity protein-like surface antigen